ncbi:MAG: FtsX-like permease family protein [Burkholderiales bacterium]
MKALYAAAPVLYALVAGTWREHRGRLTLAVLGIAFGVALGVAVHLINASAAEQFDLAVRSLAGEADLIVRGPRSGFGDSVYARIAVLPQVRAASPGVEVDAQIAGRRETIRVLGLDPFRAAEVQPQLLGDSRESIAELLQSDAVAISQSAAADLNLKTGDTLRLQAGSGIIELRIVHVLAAGATSQRIAIMDIATAQWRLERLGELHRIDLKLKPGTNVARFTDALGKIMPPGVIVQTPRAEAQRNTSLSRAYRVNLDMLALVALFTGAFLVFSTQFLALLKRRTHIALMRVIGLTRTRLLALLVCEGAIVGVLGSALGIAIGIALAHFGIERLGGDLGAGYFHSVTPELSIPAGALIVLFLLGVFFATLGAAMPAFEAARRPPALALKAGDEEQALEKLRVVWPAFAAIALGGALSQAPPIHDLPLAGYLAIALILIGAILLMPRVAETVLVRLPRLRHVPAALAAAQLEATPRQVGVSLAAILASFSLMVSMLIMVASFRTSLETWLDQMLPADLYVRAGRIGEAGFFSADEQERMAAAEGVGAAAFLRSQNVLLRSDRPAVTLLARPIPAGQARPPLPFEGAVLVPAPGKPPPVWLSEIAADVLGAEPGTLMSLPLGNALHSFTVAGIWRDYARQNGAIVIDRALYIKLTGDERANEAAVHVQEGRSADRVASAIRAALGNAQGMEIVSTRELKAVSLAIFDRTFAITYALEAAAVLIGVFGVSTSFSAQALARRREFGVLRHIGMTRRQVTAMLGWEGLIVGGLGVAAGLAVGWAISLILIHVINKQSFHWTLDMHLPTLALLGLAAALVAAAGVTAVVSGRRAMGDEVTRAVREDW